MIAQLQNRVLIALPTVYKPRIGETVQFDLYCFGKDRHCVGQVIELHGIIPIIRYECQLPSEAECRADYGYPFRYPKNGIHKGEVQLPLEQIRPFDGHQLSIKLPEQPTLLSLFDYSGNWSKPYKDAGWNVVQIDIKLGVDIWKLNPSDFDHLNVKGILNAVPCDHFAASGARWWAEKDADGRTQQAIALVKKSLEFIEYFGDRLDFWALENPVGRIGRLCGLGRPTFVFNPCDFGADYTKKTCLWGDFIPPTPLFLGQDLSTEPTQGSKMHRLPPTPDRKELRSVTPAQFAEAFYKCNSKSTPQLTINDRAEITHDAIATLEAERERLLGEGSVALQGVELTVSKCSKRKSFQAFWKAKERIFDSKRGKGKVKRQYIGMKGSPEHQQAIAARARRNAIASIDRQIKILEELSDV